MVDAACLLENVHVKDLSDAQLVEGTRNGKRDAYAELVARYQGHVYGLAYSLVDNWAEAQDIAQEAFIRAYCNLDGLKDPSRFAAWLRRVAFSVAMDWLRTFRPGLQVVLLLHARSLVSCVCEGSFPPAN